MLKISLYQNFQHLLKCLTYTSQNSSYYIIHHRLRTEELKATQSQLAVLDRKIMLDWHRPSKYRLTAWESTRTARAVLRITTASTVDVNATVVDAPSTTDDQKKSMVAEQIIPYFPSIAISYNRVIRTL